MKTSPSLLNVYKIEVRLHASFLLRQPQTLECGLLPLMYIYVQQRRPRGGGVGMGPTGYPARKEEDLVQLGFFSCNLSSSITL